MMARMPEHQGNQHRGKQLSRRAMMRLGVSAAAGAAGAFAFGTLRESGPSIAGPPVEMTSAGTPLAPLAPPAPLEPGRAFI